MEYINELISRLDRKNIHYENSTEEQMINLRSLVKEKRLPQAYIEFMSYLGNGTDGQYMGDSCFMDEIFDLQQGALELLDENKSINKLTDDDFVFWMSQGCMFCFFKLTEGDNPPVYCFNENGEDKFIKIANTITDFFINRMEMSKDTFKEKYSFFI